MSDSYLSDNKPRDILLSLEDLAAKKLPHAPTFRKAADEITRLRADLAAVTAERDRMREALSYYAEEDYNGYNGNGACARAAIEGVKEPANTQIGVGND